MWHSFPRPFLAAVLALPLAVCGGPSAPSEVPPLVDAEWLHSQLDAVVVLDIRSDTPDGEATYGAGHIPGAVHASYSANPWRVNQGGIPGMLPSIDDLARLVGSLGVSNQDHVVLVPEGAAAGEFGSATRLFWEFKFIGHDAVSILEGGHSAWVRAGYPVETEANSPTPVVFHAHVRPELLATKEDVIAAMDHGIPLIDARGEDSYRGEAKSGATARAGTIAGATHLAIEDLFDETSGSLRDAGAASRLWEQAGLPANGEQITFCNTGHMASLAWFAAYALLGNEEARLYDGSLAEWSADASLPMDHVPEEAREPAVR